MENTAITTALPPQDGQDYILTEEGWVLDEPKKDILKEKWYTVKEAAKEVGRTPQGLNAAIKRGYLKAKKISDSSSYGFHYLIGENDLIEYIDNPLFRKGKGHKSKTHKEMAKKVNNHEEPKKDIPEVNMDAVMEMIQTIIDKTIEERISVEKDIWYHKGFDDGRLDIQLDHDDAYRKGVEEGKKQAKDELLALLKEVG